MTDTGDLSQTEVDFLLASAGGEATSSPTIGTEGQTVTMRGDLEQINLADIFQTLAMTKMEGVLRLRNPLDERHVHCRDGHVRLAQPERAIARRLAQRLLHAGVLRPEQLRAALLEQKKRGVPFPELLMQAGLVGQEQLDELLAVQTSEDLFALFTWRHGTFEFWKGALSEPTAQAAFERCPEFEVNSLLLEIARRSDEWQSILAAIGNLDDVPLQVDAGATVEDANELHDQVFAAVDGKATYRDIAEQTTDGLFEVARAARDLARVGAIANLDDGALVALAGQVAEAGNGSKALLLLQTLRDRPGERALGVQQGIAAALEKAGEKRLAAGVLLEAAQRQAEPATALDLAERARKLAPFDPTTLSYLRTVLLAHAPNDATRLEQVTVQLLDALLEDDDGKAVLELVATARATGTASPAVLTREARGHQKNRDVPAAVTTWLEVAAAYDAAGDRARAVEAYDAVLRLDRSRKDVARLVRGRRRTPAARLVRLLAAIAVVAMGGAVGVVYWQQSAFDTALAEAGVELDALLAKGDAGAARERWEHWLGELGACEAVEDLRNRIAFAEAAERGRQQKQFRARVSEQLQVAAETLVRGEVGAALSIYRSLHAEPLVRTEVQDVANHRLSAAASEVAQAAKTLLQRMPPDPANVFDRAVLEQHAKALAESLPDAALRRFDEFAKLLESRGLPEFVTEATTEAITKHLAEARPSVDRGRALAAGYADALRDHATQRRLDPMFKAAVEKANAFEFQGALALFRELATQPVGDPALRVHFQEQVARLARIVQTVEAQKAAALAGDHASASASLRELRMAFPEVPFQQLLRLPLRITSTPTGAEVRQAGTVLGTTPLLVQRSLAEPSEYELRLAGCEPATTSMAGEGTATIELRLGLAATRRWQHGGLIDSTPAVTPDGRLLIADRRGFVEAVDPNTGAARWNWRSGDLSGLLQPPVPTEGAILVASLDGELRALDPLSGTVRWSLSDLPTEVPPMFTSKRLVLATTDQRLVALDIATKELTVQKLVEPISPGGLLAHDDIVVTVGDRGSVRAYRLPNLTPLWQQRTKGAGHAVRVDDLVVVASDSGALQAMRLADGLGGYQEAIEGEPLGTPAPIGGEIAVTTAHEVVVVMARTGRRRTTIPARDTQFAGPAITIGERLVVPTREGTIWVMATDGTLHCTIDAAPKSRPLAADGLLLVVEPDRTVRTFRGLR